MVEEAAPSTGWREAELARRAELHEKGSVDEHLAALTQLEIVESFGGRYFLNEASPLLPPLRRLLSELDLVPDAEVTRR